MAIRSDSLYLKYWVMRDQLSGEVLGVEIGARSLVEVLSRSEAKSDKDNSLLVNNIIYSWYKDQVEVRWKQ